MAVARRNLDGLAAAAFQGLQAQVEIALRCHQLQPVADREAVFTFTSAVAPLAGQLADELLALGEREAALVVLVFVVHVTAQETLGIAAVGQGFEGVHQRLVERPAGQCIIDGLAVDLRGTRHVVALGAAFDLQRVHAHLHQPLDMLYGAQVLEFMM